MSIKSKKSGILSTIILFLLLLVGLSVMFYPIVSNWWNSKVQSRAVAAYQEKVAELDNSECERIRQAAYQYNQKLAQISVPLLNYDEVAGYDDILDITGTGIMGYICIPQINVELPIYHGISESVLNVAVGHMQGSSLPVGGLETHCVISAHRGLPSATLFSNLDQLVVGDEFTLNVLDEVLTYEVDQILIVLPKQTEALNIVAGEDYVTLTTCTPYGINTHRLLVRGHRIATVQEGEVSVKKVYADALQVDSMQVVPFIAAPLVIGLLIIWFTGGKKKEFPHNNPLSLLEDDSNTNNTIRKSRNLKIEELKEWARTIQKKEK